jgi:RNA polymerase sigma factor (sigma-70 family)
VRRYPGLDFQDVVQSGMVGLLRACQEFDPGNDAKFSTYASHWINQAFRHEFMGSALIRLPQYLFLARYGDRCAAARARVGRSAISSLDAGSAEPADDAEGPDAEAERHERIAATRQALRSLDAEALALVLGRADGETFRRLGEEAGVCHETARARHTRAMATLRSRLRGVSCCLVLAILAALPSVSFAEPPAVAVAGGLKGIPGSRSQSRPPDRRAARGGRPGPARDAAMRRNSAARSSLGGDIVLVSMRGPCGTAGGARRPARGGADPRGAPA